MFNWSRDAMSKVERGDTAIGLFDYLRLMDFYRERVPSHPAVALANRLLPGVPHLAIHKPTGQPAKQ
jgi:hypothetical protein